MTGAQLAVLGAACALAALGFALANIRLLVVVTMSLAAFTMTWNNVRVGSLTLSDLLLLATIGLVMVSPIQIRPVRKLFGGTQRSLVIYVVLLAAGGLVGGVLRQQADVGWGVGLRVLVSVVGIVFLVSALVRRREDFERYALWYVLGAAINGLIAITGGELIAGRPIGLTNHPNHLGLTMVLAFFLSIATMGSSRKLVTYVAASCLAPIVAAIIVSGSRGALLATSIGFFSLLLMRRGGAMPSLLGLAAMAGILLVALPETLRSGPSGFGRLISPTSYDVEAAAERLSSYREASELIQASPVFGEGFSRALDFHNAPLQAAVVGGLVGLVALLILLRAAFQSVRFACVPGRPRQVRACGAGLIASAIFLMLAPNLNDRYYLFFLSMAFLACSSQLDQREGSAQRARDAEQRATHPV